MKNNQEASRTAIPVFSALTLKPQTPIPDGLWRAVAGGARKGSSVLEALVAQVMHSFQSSSHCPFFVCMD